MHLWSRYFSPNVVACGEAAEKGGIATIEEANANGLAYDENLAKAWEEKKTSRLRSVRRGARSIG